MPLTVDTFALTDLSRVKRALVRADMSSIHEDLMIEMINYVSSWVELFCNRQFLSRTYTHDATAGNEDRINGDGTGSIYLSNPPVTAVSSLKLTPSSNALVEGWDEDFVVHEGRGQIELIGFRTEKRPGIIECVYTGGFVAAAHADAVRFGYETRGQDIEGAVVEQIVSMFKRQKDGATGLQSFSSEGGTFTFNNDAWLPHVRDALLRRRVM